MDDFFVTLRGMFENPGTKEKAKAIVNAINTRLREKGQITSTDLSALDLETVLDPYVREDDRIQFGEDGRAKTIDYRASEVYAPFRLREQL